LGISPSGFDAWVDSYLRDNGISSQKAISAKASQRRSHVS
jgi:hypothetical protein